MLPRVGGVGSKGEERPGARAGESFPGEGGVEVPTAEATSAADAPPPNHPLFPLLDGMRAIAVLCVIGVHTLGAARLATQSTAM